MSSCVMSYKNDLIDWFPFPYCYTGTDSPKFHRHKFEKFSKLGSFLPCRNGNQSYRTVINTVPPKKTNLERNSVSNIYANVLKVLRQLSKQNLTR